MFPGAYDPDRIAITMAGRQSQLTYREVEAFSNQFAHLCRRHGLKQGDGIALCLENHLYFLPICWGAFRAGLYFTAISYRLQPAEVEYIVNDSGAKILITSAHLTEQFEALAPNLVNEPACYMLDGQSAKAGSLLDALSELPTTRIPDETCGQSLLYSSGTTADPRESKSRYRLRALAILFLISRRLKNAISSTSPPFTCPRRRFITPPLSASP